MCCGDSVIRNHQGKRPFAFFHWQKAQKAMPQSDFPLRDKNVAFSGKLGGVSRREARRLVKNCGGNPVELDHEKIDLVIVGADELPMSSGAELLDDRLRAHFRRGELEVITETQLWERLGMLESDDEAQRLYTPAMIADLLRLPVAVIRKWHRRGLIRPRREVHRLPYFDFQEVNTARRLAELVEGGASPVHIRKNLERLAEYLPEIDRPLAQLSVIIEGKNVLLRRDDSIIEPNGQIRLDFGGLGDTADDEPEEDESRIPFPSLDDELDTNQDLSMLAPDELMELAGHREDEGHLDEAIGIYRTLLISHGPHAEANFRLAELLYRLGEIEAARERFYATIELDEEFVEARANLGCVLTELGQDELAVSAFEGVLEFHYQYPDVHFHLARTLDRLKRPEEAEIHWREFLKMSPESPWAEEARQRLDLRSISETEVTS